MNVMHQLTTIFCQIDDFCKEFDKHTEQFLLPAPAPTHQHGPACGLAMSEIMTILIMFHMIRFRDFKTFYCGYVQQYCRREFPGLPSYERFITIMKRAILPMLIFTQLHTGKRTGLYYIDSSCLPVCHLKRSSRHKVFEEIAKYGKTSVGWFFGLKLHIVVNDQGQLIAFKITQGNKHDVTEVVSLLKGLSGLSFGDKGYISKKIFEELLSKGMKLITRKRKNMKEGASLSAYEKQLLNQRGIVETVIGHLKHHYQIWHSRHRSIFNAITHLTAALSAYVIEPLSISAIKLLSNP